MVMIYVLNKDGTPLMPIHKEGRAWRMVHSKKAHVACRNPLTIQLNKQLKNPIVDACVLGIDPGRANIGLCVINSKGNVLFASNVETRNKEVPKRMCERAEHRHASRRGERKRRQRRAASADPTGMAKITEYWRMLPGCKKPVRCKVIRNSPSRFLHRKRKSGWLTPTATHLVRTHVNTVRKVMGLLPIASVSIELNRFDFARMEDPGISGWEYQMGRLAGYNSVEEAVSVQQDGKCLLCRKRTIVDCHHIVPKSKGGSDHIDNRAGLCKQCHEAVHKDPVAKARLQKRKEGLYKKYHALSVINQAIPYILNELVGMLPVHVTTGWETHKTRKEISTLPVKKEDDGTHYMDAWCIAVSALDGHTDSPSFEGVYHTIRQFRRHDRSIIKAQKERTYYLDGKVVAHNRRRRTGQADGKAKWESLADFRARHPEDVCHLTVRKSTRSYNNRRRVMPGSIFQTADGTHVLRGTQSNGTRFYATDKQDGYYKLAETKITRRNAGLVFL